MRSRSAAIAACWASSATSRDEDSGRPQLLGGARQRIAGDLHPAADHRHEQADQGDTPGATGLPGTDAADSGQPSAPGGHSRRVTGRTCAHAITLSANWLYPGLTARRGYKSTEKLMKHSGRSGGDGFVRVEVAAYPQSGEGRIHAGQHFQHVPQVGDYGFGRRAAARHPGRPGAVGQRHTIRRPHEYI
jgi:hypothetical protein